MARRGGIWTAANVVTCVRVALIPLFMVLATAARADAGTSSDPVLAAASFALYVALALTDKLDGHLARSRGEVTDFGKFLDPIADKLLVFSALLLLLEQQLVGVWAVFAILAREFLVSALRMLAGVQGEVIAAGNLGKAKTAVTLVSISCYYATLLSASLLLGTPTTWLLGAADALMIVAVALTVASGVQYFWNARHVVFRA
ncbi:CDP-diacylglycerol--glycerol-3-phosphate 3-phosphatidyltransferase [Thermophilibacter immobilis]|uniref:CDP-diacylglycerol--glycerol-3-phosphate 3-phosphatidyltransferase n=1 Tax=Thermophilibacter immobilis TaxID=2779519 RepID=A0A7S7MBN8_9ACTN|nr:CDP-diacylglycerol--glycerol-3-phosphate 3-phosphatidyltransferase [Thermophilibacter immobilis]QOY61478.1 CDP-diacylglycerol--glycerol-3-phosphate 3-phosphatidyltransferase [Thermophilibacter immobilis]